ncbi:MAG: AEC family transporter [Anaerolineae bacterium]|nr:MAG: AEC family transporter [Anaerolineae bacterium]
MSTLISIFVDNILPVFIAAGLGYLLDHKFHLDVKTISRTSFYVLAPCLIFTSLTRSSVSGEELGRIVLFQVLVTAMLLIVTWSSARLARLSRQRESAFLLSVVFVNAGNYGLSVNLFAFGEEALARALIYFVGSTVLLNSLGIFLASRGRADAKTALLNVFKVPMIYAVILAFVARSLPWSVTETSWFRGLDTRGRAGVPVMLLLLGMQLARNSLGKELRRISAATFMRLVLAPLLSLALAAVMGLAGDTRRACVLEASMPTAVTSVILALEFDVLPDFVTGVIFLSTLLSPLSLTVLIALLR